MPFVTNGRYISKRLLVPSVAVSNKIQALFSMIFVDVFNLVKYVSRDITKTDAFHLIIPYDCFEFLHNDPVYRFPQVEHIFVICDSISDLNRIKDRYIAIEKKVIFCTIHDFFKSSRETVFNEMFGSANPIDQSIKQDILSSNEAYLYAKKLAVFSRLSPVLSSFTSTSLYCLPVKNVNNFTSCFICPSCQLIYQQPYQLECTHHQCGGCLNMQKNCAICRGGVSYDKISLDVNLQMNMQDLSTDCLGCEWKGAFNEYSKHLTQTHPELITCLIANRQIDEDISYVINSPANSNALMSSLNGTCLWEISNVNDIIDNAVHGNRPSIYSTPFYLFQKGYKICLRLFINGDLKGRNTHMSLFYVIMRGEYDEDLQWPFKFKVTFVLIDQSTSDDKSYHISQSFWPDIKPICFDIPKFDMNLPYGISKCFSLDLFKEKQDRFVVNDTMFIKAQFEISAKKPVLTTMADMGEVPKDVLHVDLVEDEISAMICNTNT